MSLLLDALKEAGDHRKAGIEPGKVKKETSEILELELELDLDGLDEQILGLDGGGPEKNAEARSAPGSREYQAEVKADNTIGEKNSENTIGSGQQESLHVAPQAEKAARAVFRNRAKGKLEATPFIVGLGALLLLALLGGGYFFWTLTNAGFVDDINVRAKYSPVDGTDSDHQKDNSKTISDSKDLGLAQGDRSTSSPVKPPVEEGLTRGSTPSIDVFESRLPPAGGAGERADDSERLTSAQEVDETPLTPLPLASSTASISGGISIRKRHIPNQTRRSLTDARRAMGVGDWPAADVSFRQVLAESPKNIEALTGLGDVMVLSDRKVDARSFYLAALAAAPGNINASVGLLNLKSNKTSVEHGSELKQLLNENPRQAFIHANLGDYYALQGEWPAAQAAYFEAFSYNAMSADYAFNLAVALDQMGKGNIALGYYQQALKLMTDNAGRFDKNQLLTRITELSGAGQ